MHARFVVVKIVWALINTCWTIISYSIAAGRTRLSTVLRRGTVSRAVWIARPTAVQAGGVDFVFGTIDKTGYIRIQQMQAALPRFAGRDTSRLLTGIHAIGAAAIINTARIGAWITTIKPRCSTSSGRATVSIGIRFFIF